MMKKIILILTILISGSISGTLLACSCIGQNTVEQEIKRSDAVLVGTIISKKRVTLAVNDTIITFDSIPVSEYKFLVEAVYKGKITKDTISIFTGNGGGDCGIRFQTGEKYIIYGENETYLGNMFNQISYPKGKNILWTHTCSRTYLFKQEEITEIKKYIKKKTINYE